jgi:thiosulfate/3-mercaptopyruvate sulfurtransferase
MMPLIDVEALGKALHRAIIVDASWVYGPLNAAGIDVRERYAQGHIPGSWFLDLDALSDPKRRLDPRIDAPSPPRPGVLRAALARAGATAHSLIVVTDMDGGCTTAPFARHALIDVGFTDVRLLDGGTPAWAAAGGTLTDEAPRRLQAPGGPPADPGPGEGVFASLEMLTAALAGAQADQVVDSRMEASNTGILPRDYEDLALPTGLFVSSASVVEEAGAGLRFKPAADLRTLLMEAGIEPGRRKITSCHFGLGASVVATAIELAGLGPVAPHPGPLVEWAVRTGRVCPQTTPTSP